MRTIPLALKSLCTALCISFAVQSAHAQTLLPANDVPRTISYQGALTNNDGTPVLDGEYTLTLSLYADPTGTVKIWQDTYTTSVTGGIFNLYLGGGKAALPDQATMNKPLWIGLQINDADPMASLTPLSASPYALNVPDRAITTAKLADGAVTADKVDMDYIGGIRVNGQPVTAKGSLLNLEGSEDIALTYNDETNTLRLSRPAPATRGDGEKGTNALAGTGTDVVWSLTGDAWDIPGAASVTPASGDWIGTSATSGATFEMRTNGETIMRYQPNGANTPNVVGGNAANTISATIKGSVIAGGGASSAINDINDVTTFADYSVISGGSANILSGSHSTIGGGYFNQVYNRQATIGGGNYNQITTNGQDGTIGGGAQNEVDGDGGTIAGGYDNAAYSDYTTIGGGYFNEATDLYSTVSGGRNNHTFGEASTIAGGKLNEVRSGGSTYAAILGGLENIILPSSNYSTLVGGAQNVIHDESEYSFIGGGTKNHISGSYSVVGGGDSNVISSFWSTIGGGIQNTILAGSATITGGENHYISGTGTKAFIGGGQNHYISNAMAVIAGGREDTATGYASAIGGGKLNKATGDYSTIGGGDSNITSGTHSFVGGGFDNNATGAYSTVGAGDSNIASGSYSTAPGGYRNSASGNYSTAGGGGYHIVAGNYSTVSGGAGNATTASYATISGGELNSAGSYAVIGGGDSHIASGLNSTIAGGWDNTASAFVSTIGGGEKNSATASRSTIAGGSNNAAGGTYSAIPGGDHLQTTGYAQTAAGFYNAPRGALTSRPTAAATLLNNDPLFMVGNGGSGGPRANAFEVSYNGHSVVYDVNGASTAGGRVPFRGATYVDNVIYAWGSVGAAGGTFGVTNIIPGPVGTTTITINVLDPVTNAPVILTNAAITATLVGQAVGEFGCGTIRVSAIGVPGPNQFQVYTYGTNCTAQDIPFMFHLTGRP